MHGWNDCPLVGVWPEALCSPVVYMAIITPHSKDASVQHSDAHIAAAEVHGCHLQPGVCAQIHPGNSVEMLLPVRATDTVDTPRGIAVTGTRALLIVCQVDPDVSADVIRLNAVSLTSR